MSFYQNNVIRSGGNPPGGRRGGGGGRGRRGNGGSSNIGNGGFNQNNWPNNNNPPNYNYSDFDNSFKKFRDDNERCRQNQSPQMQQPVPNNVQNRRYPMHDNTFGGNERNANKRRTPVHNVWPQNYAQTTTNNNTEKPSETTPPVIKPLLSQAVANPITKETTPLTPNLKTEKQVRNEKTQILPKEPVQQAKEAEQKIVNIKSEKKEVKKTPEPPSTSSSSATSSEDEAANKKVVQHPIIPPVNVTPVAAVTKQPAKNAKTASSSSSSTSSSESEEEISSKQREKKISKPKPSQATTKKKNKKKDKSKVNEAFEEDIVCLGNLEKKYVVDDDDEESVDAGKQNTSKDSDKCLLCDKKGHTSFQCQMICKNCNAPFHNLKACSKPPNLHVMLQSFMEFCMHQLSQFNPMEKFAFPQSSTLANGVMTTPFVPPTVATVNSMANKLKRKQSKTKLSKRSAKKKRKHSNRDDDDDDDDDNDDDDDDDDDISKKQNDNSTTDEDDSSEPESESESNSSAEIIANKKGKKRSKRPKKKELNNSMIFGSPFATNTAGTGASMSPFASLAYNPMLLGQMMHSAFPSTLNFK